MKRSMVPGSFAQMAIAASLMSSPEIELVKEPIPEPENDAPPLVLSLEPKSPDFHPCYVRVGVRIDGVERSDIAYYNCEDLSYKTEHNTSHLATTIEPYWRFIASRQQRRAESRFRTKNYAS
jgi:hypothetical protein